MLFAQSVLAVPICIDVASTNKADIDAAIAAAQPGDVVRFPFKGAFDFGTAEIQPDKRIMFSGWTREETILTRSVTSANRIIKFLNTPAGTNLFGVANLTLDNGPGAAFGLLSIGNTSGVGKTNHYWRIHHVLCDNVATRAFQTFGTSMGVFDRCLVRCSGTVDRNQQGWTIGTASFWEQDVGVDVSYGYTLGGFTNFVFIEDCGWLFPYQGDSSVEMYGSARLVMRNTTGTNSGLFGVHENTDPYQTQAKRSACIYWVYSNIWTHTADQGGDNMVELRSGWGAFDHNTLNDQASNSLASGPLVTIYRSSGTNTTGFPNKSYTDCRMAATGNVTISNPGTSTFDGVSASNGDRILLWQQTTGTENGVYIFNGSGSAMTRSTDLDTSAEFVTYRWIHITAGTTYTNKIFQFYTRIPITLGTTPLDFHLAPPSPLHLVNWFISITGTNRLDGNLNTNTSEYGYPAFEGPGRGDPTTWTATNSIQTFHGVYQWSNVFNNSALLTFKTHVFLPTTDNAGLTGANGTQLADNADLMKLNRDYFDSPKPGIVYPDYPHPYVTIATLSPGNTNVPSGTQINFAGQSGSGVFLVYEFMTNNSGGTINRTNGVYIAGNNDGVDTIRAMDSHANYTPSTLVTVVSGSPTITFVANPSTIVAGQTSTLSWTTSGAMTVTLDGSAVPNSGSTNVSPTVPTVYTLVASNSHGTNTATVTVNILPTVSFTATPSTIVFGNSSSLVWHTTNATVITLDGVPVSAHGTNIVFPASTTSYSLLASNASVSTNALQTVSVINLPPRNLIVRSMILMTP